MKKILAVLLAAAMVCAMAVVGFAAEKPTYCEYDSKPMFFANGTPITISEPTSVDMGATITWGAGNSMEVPDNCTIVGGYHNKETAITTSITMTGGTVRNIVGGGLHESRVTKATIVMNGGTVTAIQGGGLSSFVHQCSCDNGNTWYDDDPKNSPCQVNSVSITINGGTVTSSVFGGGEGIGNTDSTTITINDGDLAYVIAGGSNGRTGTASLTIKGGRIDVVQSVNRGSMDSASMEMTGGSVDIFYLGGETGDTKVNGIIGKVEASLTGGTVTTLEAGTNGGKDMADEENAPLAGSTVTRVEAAEGVVTTDNTGDSITVEDAPLWTGDSDSYTATDNDANTTETQDAIRAGEDVSVKVHNPTNAISLKTMNLLGANSGASLTVSVGDMSVTIPGGFGAVTEAGRVYYPLNYRSPAKAASEMEELAGDADCEAVEAGAPMTMPTAVTVTLDTDLEGTVHVYLWSEDTGKLTYVASPVEKDGEITFTTSRLGDFLLTNEKL